MRGVESCNSLRCRKSLFDFDSGVEALLWRIHTGGGLFVGDSKSDESSACDDDRDVPIEEL